ncbi:hypothetical protein FACS1894216_05060 [Synergistales bacterium]|nr:hypothetical protein FACS1894216_05060 [Synergistales bacterium]
MPTEIDRSEIHGCSFYRNWHEALSELSDEEYGRCARAINHYLYTGEIIELSGMVKTIFMLIKPNIDKSAMRKTTGSNGGKSKGQKSEKQNRSKTEANDKQSGSKQPRDRDRDRDRDREPGSTPLCVGATHVAGDEPVPPAQVPEKPKASRAGESEYPPEFEAFWAVYPRQVRKKDAFAHWKPNIRADDAPRVIEAAETYAKASRCLGKSPDKIMHPQTFIMSERWLGWLPPDGAEYLDARKSYIAQNTARAPNGDAHNPYVEAARQNPDDILRKMGMRFQEAEEARNNDTARLDGVLPAGERDGRTDEGQAPQRGSS